MPSWDDIKDALNQKGGAAADDGSVTLPGPTPLIVRQHQLGGRSYAMTLAVICRAVDCDPRRALVLNKDLERGTLLAVNGALVMRDMIDLERADATAELERVIASFGRDAATVRALVTARGGARPIGSTAVFDNYA